MGGTTSIDITKPGIDKAYGIRKLETPWASKLRRWFLSGTPYSPAEMTIRPERAGVVCIQVRDPNETKRVIEAILACLDRVKSA